MKNSIQVLIENYNKETKLYEFGKQEIVDVSSEELKNILNQFPITSDMKSIPARIISKELIFMRIADDLFVYQYNYSFSLFLTARYLFRMDKSFEFQLNDIQSVINKPKHSNLKRSFHFISSILDRYWLLYPFSRPL